MNPKTLARFGILAFLPLVTASADSLGRYTFDNKSTLDNALQASSLAHGLLLSNLGFNATTTLDFAGLDNLPNSDADGFGFGNNAGSGAMFFHRAIGSEPSAWGNGTSTSAATAPLNFTVHADATHTVTVDSITITTGDPNPDILFYLQESDAATGSESPAANSLATITVPLDDPAVVPAGTSKTFTIKLNSGNFDSAHVFNVIEVNGSTSPQPTTPIGSFTFDDRANLGTALQASTVTTGASVSNLGFNSTTTLDFAGLDNLPASDTDGYGFGNNSGSGAMFFHRAIGSEASAWGPWVNTSVAVAPMHFTVTADATHTVTVDSISIITGDPNNDILAYFQEAGTARGGESLAGGFVSTITVSAITQVVIPPGTSKTFTILLNSGAFDSAHVLDAVRVNGSVATAGNTYSTWAATHAGSQTPDLDFDGDGTSNGIEFFMGDTESGFTTRPAPVAGVVTWPRDPSATVNSFAVQLSETLASDSWTNVIPPDPNLDLSNPDEVKFTLPPGSERKFCRLVVTP